MISCFHSLSSGPPEVTITTGIYTAVGTYTSDFGQILAMMFLSALPMLAFFFALQREFIAGLTSGALKDSLQRYSDSTLIQSNHRRFGQRHLEKINLAQASKKSPGVSTVCLQRGCSSSAPVSGQVLCRIRPPASRSGSGGGGGRTRPAYRTRLASRASDSAQRRWWRIRAICSAPASPMPSSSPRPIRCIPSRPLPLPDWATISCWRSRWPPRPRSASRSWPPCRRKRHFRRRARAALHQLHPEAEGAGDIGGDR